MVLKDTAGCRDACPAAVPAPAPGPVAGQAGVVEILNEAFQGRMGGDCWLEALIDRLEARP